MAARDLGEALAIREHVRGGLLLAQRVEPARHLFQFGDHRVHGESCTFPVEVSGTRANEERRGDHPRRSAIWACVTLLGLLGRLAVPALEALHPAGGVDQLLLAGEQRVAGRADLETDLFLGRAGLEGVAARAVDLDLVVLGMDSGLHADLRPPKGPVNIQPGRVNCKFRASRPPGYTGAPCATRSHCVGALC